MLQVIDWKKLKKLRADYDKQVVVVDKCKEAMAKAQIDIRDADQKLKSLVIHIDNTLFPKGMPVV